MNLGNREEHTIREFALIACEAVGVELRVDSRLLPIDDPARRRPDISLAKSLIYGEPRVSLEDGIRKTIESVRRRKRASAAEEAARLIGPELASAPGPGTKTASAWAMQGAWSGRRTSPWCKACRRVYPSWQTARDLQVFERRT